jgi:predicted nuclease of restriction endonuclease-like (RecB) superfamily
MRAFLLACRIEPTEKEGDVILPQAVAEISWGHHAMLLDKVKDRDERIFFARAALAIGWSRSVLAVQIESQLARRQGKALTNFQATLPPPQSDLAQQSLKDPYLFDLSSRAEYGWIQGTR